MERVCDETKRRNKKHPNEGIKSIRRSEGFKLQTVRIGKRLPTSREKQVGRKCMTVGADVSEGLKVL